MAGGGRILVDWKREAGCGKQEATGRKFAPKEVGRMRRKVVEGREEEKGTKGRWRDDEGQIWVYCVIVGR